MNDYSTETLLPSIGQLIECIEKATKTKVVHVPCQDYYARHGDSQTETLSYISPHDLIQALKQLK